MKTKFLLLFLITMIVQQTYANEESGKEKSARLRELSQKSADRIIRISPDEFDKYVMEFPRPYDVVIFFTANNCGFCQEMQLEYKKAAEFYYNKGALYPTQDGDKKLRSTYFILITFSESWRKTFEEFEFKSVPNILVSLPKTAILSPAERAVYIKRFKWAITHTDGHVTVHKFLEYINKHTQRNVEYQPSIGDALTVIGALLGSAIFFIGLFIVFKPFWLNPQVWLIGSYIIYVICSAGVVYNIIHGIPMTTTNQKGEVEWFSSQNRQQLGAEGFVMSFCLTLAGILIVLWHKAQTFSDNQNINRVVYAFLFMTVYFVILFIEDVYRRKGWYNPRFWPPDNYIQGPLMRDQGNNI